MVQPRYELSQAEHVVGLLQKPALSKGVLKSTLKRQ